MLVRILLVLTTFTLLWTGTLLHDQFGLNAGDQAIASSSSSISVSELGISRQDRCPCSAHLHSPFVANGGKLKNLLVTHWLSISSALIARLLPLRMEANAPPVAYLVLPKLIQAQLPAYIVHRALLI